MSISLAGESRPALDRRDAFGALLSLGCIAHCLAAPLALLLVPVQLALWVWSPAAHAVIAVISVGLVLAAVRPFERTQVSPLIPFLATLGCGLILLGGIWPCSGLCELETGLSAYGRMSVVQLFASTWTPLGAGCLVGMHLLNSRSRKIAVI